MALLATGSQVHAAVSSEAGGEISEHIAVLLQNEPRLALPIRQRKKPLAAYYVNGEGELLWIDTGMMPQLIEQIRSAEDQGLLPRDYAADHLQKLLDASSKAGAKSRAVIELFYSSFFLKFASDIKVGRLLPARVDKELFWQSKDVDLASALTGLARSQDLGEFLRFWEPQIPEYIALKTTLKLYRDLSRSGGWPSLPGGEVLKPGEEDERVPFLRDRLADTDGAEPVEDGANERLFDPALVAALKRFQKRHGLEPDGVLGKRTLFQLNVTVEQRIRQIVANLERWRWMPEQLGQHYVIVNIAGFELKRVRARRVEERMRVVVGLPYHRTPVFSEAIKYLEINPYWNVPYSIATKEYLPQLKRNPAPLAAKGFEALSGDKVLDLRAIDWRSYSRSNFPFRLRQRPGLKNALGRVKFMFPNRFNVYLHDTPARSLFGKAGRAFSHGCVRLARPIDLAEQVLRDVPGWSRGKIDQVLKNRKRTVVRLVHPLPVHLTYATAWRGEGDTVHFAADIYQRDKALHRALFGKPTPS